MALVERKKKNLPKSNLVHFSLKIWHLVATNLKAFLRTKWPSFMQHFPNLCRIWSWSTERVRGV